MTIQAKDYDPAQAYGAEIDTSNIGAGEIVTADLKSSAVTTAKIAASAVTTAKIANANVTPPKTNVTESITATDDGTDTGTISDTTTFATVDADSDANHIVILPTPTPGRVVRIVEDGTTGFELRSSAPSSVGINAGTGSNAESAIAGAITLVECRCVSATNWVCSQFDADADETKVEAAA